VRITVRQYYRGFVSLLGLVAGIPFISPLLHLFFPNSSKVADYVYPPLGDVEWIAIIATLGFLFATTYVVFTSLQAAGSATEHSSCSTRPQNTSASRAVES
jgi:hypothetical protein